MEVCLREYGEQAEVRLGLEQARALGSAGLVDVVSTGEPGMWWLVPGGRVGAISCGSVRVRVDPKVAIDRIMFMLGYTMRGISWRDAHVPVDAERDVVHVLADVFLRAVATALRPGMLQGYRTVEQALPVVRGRIRLDEQIKRRPGSLVPIEVVFDDFTTDIAENQILGAALAVLLRNPWVGRDTRRRLAGLAPQFAEVSRLPARAALPTWRPTRLNERYQVPLLLAELILAGSSFEHRVGDVRVDGFVLDMPRVFEDFVTYALRDALLPLLPGSTVIGQYPCWLDEEQRIDMRPDVVWLDADSLPVAVVDAKYKAERPSGFPNADVYQALAYATTLGLDAARLVYARGNEPVQAYVVRGSGVRIHAHALDLAQPPGPLLEQVAALAQVIATAGRLARPRATLALASH